MIVKLTRGVRLVCAACGQTVASAGRRVEGERLGDYLAAAHPAPGEERRCAGTLQPAPIAQATAPPPVPRLPAPERAAEQVARWNQDYRTGTRVAVTGASADAYAATTVSLAWVCDGWPSILVEEHDEPVRLHAIRPLGPEEHLAALPAPERAQRRRVRARASSRPAQRPNARHPGADSSRDATG